MLAPSGLQPAQDLVLQIDIVCKFIQNLPLVEKCKKETSSMPWLLNDAALLCVLTNMAQRGINNEGKWLAVTVLLSDVRMLFKSRRPRMMELPRVAMREELLSTTLAALGAWKAWKVGAITVAETVGSCRNPTRPAPGECLFCLIANKEESVKVGWNAF